MNFLCRLGLAAVSFTSVCAHAAEPIEIVGLGATSCSQYLQEIGGNGAVEREYLSWALGYMSGLLVRAPVGEIVQLRHPDMPLARQAEFMRAYCKNNSTASVSEAVQDLYKFLRALPPTSL